MGLDMLKEMEMREAIKVMEQDDFTCMEAYFKALEENDIYYYEAEEIIESDLDDFQKFLKIECGCYSNEDIVLANQLTVPKQILFNNIDMDDNCLKFYYNATKNSFIIEMSNCITYVVEALQGVRNMSIHQILEVIGASTVYF